MKEIYEFRVREKFTHLLSDPGIGERLQLSSVPGSGYRVIKVSSSDPLFYEIGELEGKLLASQGEHLFLYWDRQLSYSSAEIESAELFHLIISHAFEPSGEECGTKYDESATCPSCGAGAPQGSNLFLDSRKLPRKKDIARTIADEWIVSQRLVEISQKAAISGVEFRQICHKALFEEDPLDLSRVDAGKRLLELARTKGLKQGTAAYYLWLNSPEQRELLDDATEENVRQKEVSQRRRAGPIPAWRQLLVTSRRIPVVPPTRAGTRPFEGDLPAGGRCEYGDTIGLRLLSEMYVSRSKWDGSDVFVTEHFIGTRRGLLRPAPAILVTARVRRLFVEKRLKGARFEIAHFC